MAKGPRLNNISRKLTTRNSLGIEGVATTISAEICPIVNTVTPRPFYWAFMIWGFYDFYKNCKPKDRNANNVYKYIKKHNYFFALASNINETDKTNGFAGADNTKKRITANQEKYNYDENYLKTTLSNMVYYLAGLYTMGLITDEDTETHKKHKYPRITLTGEKLAKAFNNVINKTVYYQKYRFETSNIPRDVLVDLGNIININLVGFDEVKNILRDILFNRNRTRKLLQCHNYLKFIFENEDIKNINSAEFRKILYDYYSPKGQFRKQYPKELKEIANSWEIVIGRQYFTTGLEIIWKFMLECLNVEKTYDLWIKDCFEESIFRFNLEDKLSSLLKSCNYSFEERESMVIDARSHKTSHESNIENGIGIILSVYNRFADREDFSKENTNYFNYGLESNSISLNSFFNLVNDYKESSIADFIKYVMYNYLLEQHLNTAFEKMIQGRDGYYIEKIDDKYIRKEYFKLEFQGIKMVQLASVMRDLDILEV